MITRLTYEIENPKYKLLSVLNSSLFQGVLMELIDSDYAEKLHHYEINPYSQYLIFDKDKIYWCINALTKEASENITYKVRNQNLTEIHIKYKDIKLQILSEKFEKIEEEKMVQDMLILDAPRIVTIKFESPTAFKKQGKYIFYPSVRHIFQSLIKKVDALSESFNISTDDVLNDFEENIEIIRYRLKSCKFPLESVRIPAFMGEITIKTTGPQALANMVYFLIGFGQYSGVGIKTSIGMGAISIVERGAKDEQKNV